MFKSVSMGVLSIQSKDSKSGYNPKRRSEWPDLK